MFCINCGSQNVNVTSQKNEKVLIERGELIDEHKEVFEAVVLECCDCKQEMISV